MNDNVCACGIQHSNLERAKKGLLKEDHYEKLSIFYKAFSDPTRLKIMSLLFVSELCVSDICLAVDMSQPAISHQIKILKNAGIIKGRRDGKMIYYSLDDEHIEAIYRMGQVHTEHLKL